MSAATARPSQRPAATAMSRASSSPAREGRGDVLDRRVVARGEAPGELAAGMPLRRLERLRDDGSRARHRLEAPEPAAPALDAVVDDRGVADLARAEPVALEQLAAEHDPRADAVADLDRDEVGRPAADVEQVLAHGRGARVVGDEGGEPGPLGQEAAQREVLPVEVDGPADLAVGGVDEARGPDADAQEAAGGCLGDELVDEPLDRPQRGLAVATLDRHLDAAQDPAPQVHEGADEPLLAEVEADDDAGVLDDLHQDRRLAAARRAAPDLLDEARR